MHMLANAPAEASPASYLWRASLDALSFMPLLQADSSGGVIITDWYANPGNPGERMKVTVSILDRDLRADALRVAASRQVAQGGAWVDAPVQAATVQKLEEIILTRAHTYMPDHAHSSDPAVQTQLDRLAALSPGRDILGLERIAELCARLGNPQDKLPRTFHVAGTNGKGSTCAYLRAILEAQGRRVHSYTSPHLVRFNERIRLAGTLIDDAQLAALLAEVLDVAADLRASFFEVTTAAAFLAFVRAPADDIIIEVGLGGRLDATNIIPAPAVCGIASLGIDHEAFLLAPEADTPTDPAVRIAWEKAGIFKPGAALATLAIPWQFKEMIDSGFVAGGGDVAPHFRLFYVIVLLLAVATALRFYFVSWLGERTVADI
eukprot:gene26990-33645_t